MSRPRSAREIAMMKPLPAITASSSPRRRHHWPLGLLAGLAVLCCLIFVGQRAFRKAGTDAERAKAAEAHYQGAVLALRQNRLDAASAALDRAGELGYSQPKVNRLWGLVLARAGRAREAEPLLRAAWDEAAGRCADPEVADALARIAMGRFELGLALEVLERWAREDPQNPQPLLWRAEIDRRIGAGAMSRSGISRQALDRDPHCDAALLGLAELHLMMGESAKAAAAYSIYTKRVPQDVAGHVGLGISALALSDIPLAVAELDRALQLDPDHTLALKERAAINLDEGRALRCGSGVSIARWPSIPSTPSSRYQRSLVQTRLDRRDLAAADRRRWEQLRREHARIKVLQEALIANPRDIPVRSRGRSLDGRAWPDRGRDRLGQDGAGRSARSSRGQPAAGRLPSGSRGAGTREQLYGSTPGPHFLASARTTPSRPPSGPRPPQAPTPCGQTPCLPAFLCENEVFGGRVIGR